MRLQSLISTPIRFAVQVFPAAAGISSCTGADESATHANSLLSAGTTLATNVGATVTVAAVRSTVLDAAAPRTKLDVGWFAAQRPWAGGDRQMKKNPAEAGFQ